MIRVENKKTFKGDGVYVGRGSPLGNPYTHRPSALAKFRVASRDEAVDKYEEWLRDRLMNDAIVRQAFDTLVDFYQCFGDLTLLCWCAPLKCHADIIKKMILESCKCDGGTGLTPADKE